MKSNRNKKGERRRQSDIFDVELKEYIKEKRGKKSELNESAMN